LLQTLNIAGVFDAKYTKLLDDESKVELVKYPEINYESVVLLSLYRIGLE